MTDILEQRQSYEKAGAGAVGGGEVDIRDAAVECSWSEAKTLTDVMEEQVPLYFPFQRHF